MEDVFDALKAILRPHASRLVVTVDDADRYSLDTRHVMPDGKVLWFGGVRTGKRYVSYHLMPIYVDAALSASVPEALADLTERGLDAYERRGYLRRAPGRD